MSIGWDDLFPEIDFSVNERGVPNYTPFSSAFGVPTSPDAQNHHLVTTGEANRSSLLRIMDFYGKEAGKDRNLNH